MEAEYPDRPHQHCPVCLAPIFPDEQGDYGHTAMTHFDTEHPEEAAGLKAAAQRWITRMKSQYN